MQGKVGKVDTFVKHISLSFKDDLCCRCGMCALICPEEAIKMEPAERVTETVALPHIEVDGRKCVLCGICDVICPFSAFEMRMDGERKIPIVELKGFPNLIKKIDHDVSKCELLGKCVKACPRGAIKIEDGKHKIDTGLCITCPWCEDACPNNAIKVKKIIEGNIRISPEKCQSGCSICVGICPTKAIQKSKSEEPWKKGVTVQDRYCIYCGACVVVCPVQKEVGPIEFHRTSISHTPIRSIAWNTALDKLISKGAAKELRVAGSHKARNAIGNLMIRKKGQSFS